MGKNKPAGWPEAWAAARAIGMLGTPMIMTHIQLVLRHYTQTFSR
jgi:hypothetical protein